jgi:hypothetical protein
VRFGDLAQRQRLARAGAGEQDVDLALFPLDCIEQAVASCLRPVMKT